MTSCHAGAPQTDKPLSLQEDLNKTLQTMDESMAYVSEKFGRFEARL
jgi:hypothetical protein